MAVDTFIPEVWAARLLTTLPEWTVFGQPGVVNFDYEGEIADYGDTVHIGDLARPTVATYTKNSTTISPQTLTTTDQTLVIDQSKYFAFEVDDIDARQARSGGELLNKAASEAAQALAVTADTHLVANLVANGTSVTEDAVTSASDAFELLLTHKTALDNNDVPRDGNRWIVVSPDLEAYFLQDNRFLDASAYGSSAPIMNGEIGRALGFRILTSTTLPGGHSSASGIDSNAISGTSIATTFAEQIAKVEAYRPQDSFSDALKGLHLYGSKVVRPEALFSQALDIQ